MSRPTGILPVELSQIRQAGSLLARSGKLPDFRSRCSLLIYKPRCDDYNIIGMSKLKDGFTRFEHAGWERVADKYDSVWSSLTRQFIPHLISAAEFSSGMSVLDVACGPGYVSATAKELGAVSTGVDFSEKMIGIAKQTFPGISFFQGDAQNLAFEKDSFDRVLINFGLLHISRPEKACEREECRKVLEEAGFDGNSISYETRTVEWHHPSASYFFEVERDAGVRTTGLLARQSPETLDAIRLTIENGMKRYARDNEFVLPMTAHVVAVSKR